MPVTIQQCYSLISALNMVNPNTGFQYAVAGSVARVIQNIPVQHPPNDLDILAAGLPPGPVGDAITQLIPAITIVGPAALNGVQAFRGTLRVGGQQLPVDLIRVPSLQALQGASCSVSIPNGPVVRCLTQAALANDNIWVIAD